MEKVQVSNSAGSPRITFGLTWLIAAPAGLWAIVGYYLPVMGGTLNLLQSRLVPLIAILLIVFSLWSHVAAHLWAARRLRAKMPSELRILIFGDVSQVWPISPSGREMAIAAAGPAISLLIAAAAYLIWDAQINDFVGDLALLAAGFNAWIVVINLIPAFPMDGGRLVRAALSELPAQEQAARSLPRALGFLCAAVVTGWAIMLFAQNARFSLECAAITLFFAIVLLDGLWMRRTGNTEGVRGSNQRERPKPLRGATALLLVAVLFAPPASLLLMNDGVEAPGVALSTGPMVAVPPAYQHRHAGSFYLVTVISQAPITAGLWLLGQLDPAIQIVPPEIVTPKNTTPQEQARQDYQMLDDSETTAIAVGLRLAGYPGTAVGKGARVVGILPASHANGSLQAGDVITGFNGSAVQTAADLIALVGKQSSSASVDLQVVRGSGQLRVVVPLMPASDNGSPKIGISVQDAGIDFKPPFPISIETQKITGGPSAGLMFTLTVYNALSSADLTGGWKIAGTGTINLDGSVGPIGGVKQKVVAAQAVGASYFLCPADNFADAVSVARGIKVVKIATVDQAVAFLRSLPSPQ